MTEPLLVQVVGDAAGVSELIEALDERDGIEIVGRQESGLPRADALGAVDLDVILYASDGPSLRLDDLAAIREHSTAPVILLAPANAAALLQEALDADVADAVLLPQPVESVEFALRRASGRREAAATATEGRVITVFSPKGGTGKSTTATNLAAALAAREGVRTLLLDLDLQFGDAAIMLGLEPERTIADVVSAPGELDAEKLGGYTTPHTSGLDLLAAPRRPEDAELVSVAKLSVVLEVARQSYDVVVVDTAPMMQGAILAALDHTDELLLLATLDVPTLKDVRQSLETLELISFPSARVSLVLNRADAQVGIKQSEVEAALGRSFRFTLPDDRTVPLTVNRGMVAVLAEPRASFSRAIAEVARQVAAAARPRGVERSAARR